MHARWVHATALELLAEHGHEAILLVDALALRRCETVEFLSHPFALLVLVFGHRPAEAGGGGHVEGVRLKRGGRRGRGRTLAACATALAPGLGDLRGDLRALPALSRRAVSHGLMKKATQKKVFAAGGGFLWANR